MRCIDDAQITLLQGIIAILSTAKSRRRAHQMSKKKRGNDKSSLRRAHTTHLYSPGEKGSSSRDKLAVPPVEMLTDSWSV